MQHWMMIGSILPTSKSLRRKLYDLGIYHRKNLDTMMIHGVGSGELIYELVRYVLVSGVTVNRCIIIDLNPQFIKRSKILYQLLSKCYVIHTEMIFIEMDAFQTPEYLFSLGVGKLDLIVGTLPYSNMPQKIDEWIRMYYQCTKVFCYFTYATWTKRSSARVATRQMYDKIESKFRIVQKSELVWTNLPPAYAISAEA
ncbi:MAG TPA: hypothetical protein VJI73_01190 [Candidatus Paceibacterota bacterium]